MSPLMDFHHFCCDGLFPDAKEQVCLGRPLSEISGKFME